MLSRLNCCSKPRVHPRVHPAPRENKNITMLKRRLEIAKDGQLDVREHTKTPSERIDLALTISSHLRFLHVRDLYNVDIEKLSTASDIEHEIFKINMGTTPRGYRG